MWKRRDEKKGGREEPGKEDIWWTSDNKIYNAGQPVNEKTTRKLESSAVEESKRPRQSKQEPRNEERKENVRWEESLNVQNVQRERGESVGGAGQ